MSSVRVYAIPCQGAAWESDLEHSRDVNRHDKLAYAFVLHWFESWRLRLRKNASIEVAREFWKEEVKSKKREVWQIEQWAQALRWYGSRIAASPHAIT